jgi:hypothetical protein
VNKPFIKVLTAVFAVGVFSSQANARVVPDLTIVCGPGSGSNASNCSVVSSANPGVQNKNAPLFNPAVFPHFDLKPGDEFTRYIRIDNDRNQKCDFSLLGGKINTDTEVLPGKYFSQQLRVTISDGTNTIGPISFFDLFNTSSLPLYLTTLAPNGSAGESKTLSWFVTFDKDAGNEYQNAEMVFDFNWSFECKECLPPSPPPPPGICGGDDHRPFSICHIKNVYKDFYTKCKDYLGRFTPGRFW